MTHPRIFTAAEAAQILRCDQTHVRRLATDGLLGAFDVALPGARSSWRFPRSGLREFLIRRGLAPEDAETLLDGLDGTDGLVPAAADAASEAN